MPDYEAFKLEISELLKAKLNPKLTYHGFHHVENVMQAAMMLADHIHLSNEDLLLLKTAVMLHDSGFTVTYVNHEAESVLIGRKMLPAYGYTEADIDIIAGMIMATKIPQMPNNLLEYIIADADLEYLGTDQFDEISESLFVEMMAFNFIKDRDQWNQIQVNFLTKHSYFTDFCRKYREPVKQENLNKVKALIKI
jgi:HD superfamily phosphodiesterase